MTPSHLTLSLTHACNNSCTYCYAGDKFSRAMSYATATAAIDLVCAGAPEKFHLGFFGGEPLLEWDLLRRVTDYARRIAVDRKTDLQLTMTTNGTLLTRDKMEWLYGQGFWVAVSLDGNRVMHDACRPFSSGASSFEATLEGLRCALGLDPRTEVIMVADPGNVGYLSRGIDFILNETSCTRLTVNPNVYAEWPRDKINLLKRELNTSVDRYIRCFKDDRPVYLSFIDNKIIARIKGGLTCGDRCRFGENELAVAPSGRIYPCERLIGNDTDDKICIGTVKDGINREKLKRILAQRGRSNEECASCAINTICQSHCGCVNYALTGHIDRTGGVVCFFERASAAAADRAGEMLFAAANRSFLRRFYGEEAV
jgi:uncharacterized protein